jgi:hypothetical protein
VNPFETETMAELCLRQGHHDEALDIYRRLRDRTPAGAARARLDERVRFLERSAPETARPTAAGAAALPVPGVRTRRSGDQLVVEWRLPLKTPAPALEILLVTAGEAGVTTERRAIDLQKDTGQLELRVHGLHSARAAAGTRGATGFVPLARDAAP